jgi:hypothetical protein
MKDNIWSLFLIDIFALRVSRAEVAHTNNALAIDAPGEWLQRSVAGRSVDTSSIGPDSDRAFAPTICWSGKAKRGQALPGHRRCDEKGAAVTPSFGLTGDKRQALRHAPPTSTVCFATVTVHDKA